MTDAVTAGAHHIGLTVSKLEASAAFFTDILGWREVKRKSDYPAIFVSDGSLMITLWQARGTQIIPFNKDQNIGLHHLALSVRNEQTLIELHSKLQQHKIELEFSPEYLGAGPARHMMCYEPSGNRIEFIWPGNN